ncbi:tether containing UBX domain for GLUT4-like [Pyrus ussuriensis x Pyrus communis]|uniref:Tether containing UBX domain for GLUT4-like n=1 Tax=Pyrus ussuriensis x Pyrus communis TaxID=2448454 RepID=A0A5N5IFJ8_9ROSA|nr:tether containing UBX domain for GLUT4-like [Pyrus ussuriensis x Pyrus communis]
MGSSCCQLKNPTSHITWLPRGLNKRPTEWAIGSISGPLQFGHQFNRPFYDFTPEDYYQAEDAKRRSTITRAVIGVRFPDNRTVEATFHPSDKIQSLVDYLRKVIARPELPFYLFTAPAKQVMRDMSQDFYSAGFVPGAVVHLTYGVPN